ncbi:hypothetical protein TKK_0016078 [Trichogramma kaykai]
MELNRPLQWSICLLHLNEIPLRRLIKAVCRRAAGPTSFCGPYTKKLQECEKKPVLENFKIIKGDLPEIDDTTLMALITEQRFFYEICQAISSGKFSNSLAAKRPGNVTLSHWLNTGARFLRLYASTATPDKGMKVLVTYIMKVYAPMWFRVKHRTAAADQGRDTCIT